MATKKTVKKAAAKVVVPISGITYEEAKLAFDAGKKITRPIFGEDAFVFHGHPFVEISVDVNGISQQVNASAYFNVPYKSGGVLCKKTKTILIGWTPSKADIAAKDWIIIE